MNFLDTLENLVNQTAFMSLTVGNYIMIVVACVFLYLAIKKDMNLYILVPIAFGMLLVNMYPDIMKAPADGEAGGLLHYFYLLDEWSILPSLNFHGCRCDDRLWTTYCKSKELFTWSCSTVWYLLCILPGYIYGIQRYGSCINFNYWWSRRTYINLPCR